MPSQLKDERLYYLDWLRVFAVMLLIPYHTGAIFANFDFHIKNNVTSTGLTIIDIFIDNWHMLVFLLAGYHLVCLKEAPSACRGTFLRLIVPLVFGMPVIVPFKHFMKRFKS
jgi:uncharacterized membrane protein